jgi:hypothetical protein
MQNGEWATAEDADNAEKRERGKQTTIGTMEDDQGKAPDRQRLTGGAR